MLSLRKPSAERLREFLAAQSRLDLTYPAVGATAAVPPAGYVVDRTRIKLGEGAGVFTAARAALRRWEHFRLGWVETWPPDTSIQAGQASAVKGPAFAAVGGDSSRSVALLPGERRGRGVDPSS